MEHYTLNKNNINELLSDKVFIEHIRQCDQCRQNLFEEMLKNLLLDDEDFVDEFSKELRQAIFDEIENPVNTPIAIEKFNSILTSDPLFKIYKSIKDFNLDAATAKMLLFEYEEEGYISSSNDYITILKQPGEIQSDLIIEFEYNDDLLLPVMSTLPPPDQVAVLSSSSSPSFELKQKDGSIILSIMTKNDAIEFLINSEKEEGSFCLSNEKNEWDSCLDEGEASFLVKAPDGGTFKLSGDDTKIVTISIPEKK